MSLCTDALEQFKGFKNQEKYALIFLLDPSYYNYRTVYIEHIDDLYLVGDKSKRLVQIKTSFSKEVKITDSSLILWKTLANWITAIKESKLEPDTEIELLVQGNFTYNEKSLINKIITADEQSASKCYDDITKWALESYPANPNKTKPKILSHIEKFIDPKDKNLALKIIESFKIRKLDFDYLNVILEHLRNRPIQDNLTKSLAEILIGWFSHTVLSRNPMKVSRDEVDDIISTFVNERVIARTMNSMSSSPNKTELDGQRASNPRYLTEFMKLSPTDEDINEVLCDYLRTYTDRVSYCSKLIISQAEFDVFDDEILRKWRISRNRNRINYGNHIRAAWNTYYDCCSTKTGLSNYAETPNYFSIGSLHMQVQSNNAFWIEEGDDENE